MTMVAKGVTRLIVDMAQGKRESLTVAALRDTLLAKLVSGEVRVKDSGRITTLAPPAATPPLARAGHSSRVR